MFFYIQFLFSGLPSKVGLQYEIRKTLSALYTIAFTRSTSLLTYGVVLRYLLDPVVYVLARSYAGFCPEKSWLVVVMVN